MNPRVGLGPAVEGVAVCHIGPRLDFEGDPVILVSEAGGLSMTDHELREDLAYPRHHRAGSSIGDTAFVRPPGSSLAITART